MRLDRFLAKTRIVDLKSKDYRGAIKELLELCPQSSFEKPDNAKHLREIVSREKTMTTCLGNGIALPHIRVPLKKRYIFAVGRCPEGLEFEDNEEYRDLRLVFLLLAKENEKSYLNVLASLARIFQDKSLVDRIVASPDVPTFRTEVMLAFGGAGGKSQTKENKFNRLMIRETEKVARGAQCSGVLIFGETFAGPIELGGNFKGMKTVLVTSTAAEVSEAQEGVDAVLPVRSFSNNRLAQLRSSVLIGLTRDIFKYNDRLCCIGGIPQSNQFDTIVVVDIEREFQSVFTRQTDMLPPSVKPEVMERVLGVVMELAVEGREGKPVGCLFVLGDTERVKPLTKPLIMNPFYGYKGEDRNILNPFMDETVKELSSIDGAFIISGDGVLESAGTLIHAPDYDVSLPSGLGSRHAAGAAISMAADCLAIVVSSSTGQITLFRRGQMLPLMEKSVGRNI